jgi:hypothetical protein
MNLRACLSIVCLTQLLGSTVTANHASKPSETRSSSVAMTSMALPVRFERNDGQTDPRACAPSVWPQGTAASIRSSCAARIRGNTATRSVGSVTVAVPR